MSEALQVTEAVYAGEAAEFFLLRAVVEMDTYEKGCISIIDGIKKQHTLDRMEVSNFIQDAAATPVSMGSILVDDVQLIPQRFDVYMEFNPHDFEGSFFAPELQSLLMDRALPPTANNFLILQLMKKVNEYYEYATWQSRKAYNPNTGTQTVPASLVSYTKNTNFYYFDGLIEKMLLDPTTILVPNVQALTSANIRSEIDAAFALLPLALIAKYGPQGARILMSIQDWMTYNIALRTDAFKNQNTTEKSQDLFNGYDVVRLAGLPQGTFAICLANPNPQLGNLFIGMNEMGDKDNLKISPVINLGDMWGIRSEQKVDVQVGFMDQVVLYTNLTA